MSEEPGWLAARLDQRIERNRDAGDELRREMAVVRTEMRFMPNHDDLQAVEGRGRTYTDDRITHVCAHFDQALAQQQTRIVSAMREKLFSVLWKAAVVAAAVATVLIAGLDAAAPFIERI